MSPARAHAHGTVEPGAWANHALGALERAGFRRGGARRAVIDALAAEPCAVSAQQIEERLVGAGRRVGRASVYRALEQLVDLGLVHRLDLGADTGAYERVDPAGEHHHHMVCDACGKVVPFEDAALERAVGNVRGGAGFEVQGHEIVLRGACGACR